MTQDWSHLVGRTLHTTQGAPFDVVKVTARNILISPRSSQRNYDIAIQAELIPMLQAYRQGRFFPRPGDLRISGVRPNRIAYAWGLLRALVDEEKAVMTPSPSLSLTGRWHITMPNFDDAYLSPVSEPHVNLEQKGDNITGDYQFGAQTGSIAGTINTLGALNEQFLFSFEGQDELDPVNGAGVAVLANEDTLQGYMAYNHGDRYDFKWVRDTSK